jgi:hypothetical protein
MLQAGRSRSAVGNAVDAASAVELSDCYTIVSSMPDEATQLNLYIYLPASSCAVSLNILTTVATEHAQVLFAADAQLAAAVTRVDALRTYSAADEAVKAILRSSNRVIRSASFTPPNDTQPDGADGSSSAAEMEGGQPASLLLYLLTDFDDGLPLYCVGTIVIGLGIMLSSLLFAQRWMHNRARQQRQERTEAQAAAAAAAVTAATAALLSAASSGSLSLDGEGRVRQQAQNVSG